MDNIQERYRNAARRPSWIDYFMGLAFCVAERSIDPNTRHGCILTDRYNHVIGMGYNGFPRGMDDRELPIHRPDPNNPDELNKYDFVSGSHAERNALANRMVSPWLIQEGAIAYVTGKPCNDCLVALWQSHVTTVYYADRQGTLLENERTQRIQNKIVEDTRIELIQYRPNLHWLVNALKVGQSNGFVPANYSFDPIYEITLP